MTKKEFIEKYDSLEKLNKVKFLRDNFDTFDLRNAKEYVSLFNSG